MLKKKKEKVVVKHFLVFFYLDKDFLQQSPAVRQWQLWLSVGLAWSLLLVGWGWWRWRGGAWRGVGHMGKVKEQVEAFDQCGGDGHGCHAVHGFLLRVKQKRKVEC